MLVAKTPTILANQTSKKLLHPMCLKLKKNLKKKKKKKKERKRLCSKLLQVVIHCSTMLLSFYYF